MVYLQYQSFPCTVPFWVPQNVCFDCFLGHPEGYLHILSTRIGGNMLWICTGMFPTVLNWLATCPTRETRLPHDGTRCHVRKRPSATANILPSWRRTTAGGRVLSMGNYMRAWLQEFCVDTTLLLTCFRYPYLLVPVLGSRCYQHMVTHVANLPFQYIVL